MKSFAFIKNKQRIYRFMVMLLVIFSTFFQPALAFQQDSLHLEIIYSGFKNATSLSVTRNHIYVVDQGQNQVVKLDHFGNERDRIGGNGSSNYQFSNPVDVDATNGLKIYVSDYNNRRIQVFGRRGQYLSSFEAPNDFGSVRYSPTQIAVNDLGEIFFYNESLETIQHYDLNGDFRESIPLPRQIEQVDDIVYAGRAFYVLDKETEVIHELTENWMYQSFHLAEGVEAFFVDVGQIMLAFSDKLVRGDRQMNFDTNLSKQIKDIVAFENKVFILAGNKLLLFKFFD